MMQSNDSKNAHRLTHVIRSYAFQPEKLRPSFHHLKNKPSQSQRIQVNNGEIISINQKAVIYPTDVVFIEPNKFKCYAGDHYDDMDSPLKGIDRCVHIELLYPPIIINLREENTDASTQRLSANDIAYFKKMGKNTIIFIHGYNVAMGEFPKKVVDIKSVKKIFMPDYNRHGFLIDPILSEPRRTFYRNAKMITDHFGYAFSNQDLFVFKRYNVNGTSAHEWFVNMEDNLNLATGQFYRNNYLKYMRLVHVTWTGDVGVLNYMAAEDKADLAANKLLKVIDQLIKNDIEINIIAHSLGNRILLSVMNDLGQQGKNGKINHVFLWQAAVPNTALSNDRNKDTTIKNNGHFPDAHKAAKKITILFSRNDNVLKRDYYLANVLGVSPGKLKSEAELDYLAKCNAKRQLLSNRKLKIHRRLLKHVLNLIFIHQRRKELFKHLPHNNIKHLYDIDRVLDKIYDVSGEVTQALGYNGPDLKDKFIQALIRQKKLMLVDTTEYIIQHSAMKIPTEAILNNVYKKWIIGGEGIKKFGLYHLH